MISILFVREDSVYKQMGLDCWDIKRDALNWPGGNSGVFHVPCRAWGKLKGQAKPRPGEKELARWAVRQIQKWGGVLEHPEQSSLWHDMNLPYPGERDEHGGFSISVNQCWWGHRAEKRTLLYIVGIEPDEIPDYSPDFSPPPCVVAPSRNKRAGKYKSISKKEREATPPAFAEWLVTLANKCNNAKKR